MSVNFCRLRPRGSNGICGYKPLSPVVVTGYAVINGVTTVVTHMLLTNQIFVSGAVVIKGVMAAPATIKGVAAAAVLLKSSPVTATVAHVFMTDALITTGTTVVKGAIVVAKSPTTLLVAKVFLSPMALIPWSL